MSDAPIPVAVVGARGRLGALACEVLERAPDFELVARLDSGHVLEQALPQSGARVVLECTRAGLGYEHARRILELGLRPVIGTSGVSLEETRALDEAARARSLGGLVVPNFSLGMWLLQRAALEAARHFPQCEIVEMHHERKLDAPSGTAADTAERLRALHPQAKTPPIHSVRLPGMYAHQLVIFGAAGETYTLRHDMSGPAAFGPGILCAVRHAASAVGVARGLDAALAGR
ncbi:MAG: 4-hydroxy-tetrahydrodipicolinate reductase [Planctomycetes bacterium]|nr:4-hydroxy-tetrahydrodipicolinate reductase [Planctomycetota bacterium]